MTHFHYVPFVPWSAHNKFYLCTRSVFPRNLLRESRQRNIFSYFTLDTTLTSRLLATLRFILYKINRKQFSNSKSNFSMLTWQTLSLSHIKKKKNK